MKKLDFRFVSLVLVSVLGVAMVSLLFFMAAFAQPVADQYNFMANIRDHGVLGYTSLMYSTWSGRLAQTLGLGAAYRLFGDFRAQVFVPIILLALLVAAFAWLSSLLFNFKKHRLLSSVAFGLFFAGAVLYTTSCLFDIYLWLDAAVVYLLGLAVLVFDAALAVWLFKTRRALSSRKLLVAVLLLVALAGQTVGETSTVLALGWSFLVLAATCLVKKWHIYRRPAALLFFALLLGALIMFLAPGLWTRAGSTEKSAALFEVFLSAPLHAYAKMFKELSLMKIALTVVAAFFIGSFLDFKVTKKHLALAFVLSSLVFLSATYIPFVLYFLGSGPGGLESRIFAVPDFAAFLCAAVVLAFLFAYFRSAKNTVKSLADPATLKASETVALFLVALALGAGLHGFFAFNKGYFAALITRSNLVSSRAATVAEYKSAQENSAEPLIVPDAPIMIENSSAADFTSNGWVTVGWFYDSFLAYYELSPDAVLVSGEPLIEESDPPAWYRVSSRATCTLETEIVYNKYHCAVPAATGNEKEE